MKHFTKSAIAIATICIAFIFVSCNKKEAESYYTEIVKAYEAISESKSTDGISKVALNDAKWLFEYEKSDASGNISIITPQKLNDFISNIDNAECPHHAKENETLNACPHSEDGEHNCPHHAQHTDSDNHQHSESHAHNHVAESHHKPFVIVATVPLGVYNLGFIPNARHFESTEPLPSLDEDTSLSPLGLESVSEKFIALIGQDKDINVIFYDNGDNATSTNDSALKYAKIANYLGYNRVHYLVGGFNAWKALGFEVSLQKPSCCQM